VFRDEEEPPVVKPTSDSMDVRPEFDMLVLLLLVLMRLLKVAELEFSFGELDREPLPLPPHEPPGADPGAGPAETPGLTERLRTLRRVGE
jgi:hypothetical protein